MGISDRRLEKELFKEWKARQGQPKEPWRAKKPVPTAPSFIDAEVTDDDIEDAEIVTDPIEKIRIQAERNRQAHADQVIEDILSELGNDASFEEISEQVNKALDGDPKKKESSTALELREPDKWDIFRDLGYNERTRVDKVRDRDPQIVKIKEPHSCQPPLLQEFGVGSVWRCGCGARWKVRRHVFCDNADHRYNKKWTRKVLYIVSWGGSRYN